MQRIFVLTLSIWLAACANVSAPACPAGTDPMTQLEFFFGGDVGDADWRRFLESEVTPRFPTGFSVAELYGQWRNAAGGIGTERSKALIIVAPEASANATNIAAVRDAYKQRFAQGSVLFVATPVCAGF